VIPLELGTEVFAEQVTCAGAIIGAVPNLDSMKQRGREVKSAIHLIANVPRDFNLLSESRWEECHQSHYREYNHLNAHLHSFRHFSLSADYSMLWDF
jgi:hypothetical protein